VTARIRLLALALLAVLPGGDLGAQEKEEGPGKEKPPFPVRFFDRPIDFWGRGLGYEEEANSDPRPARAPEDRGSRKTPPSEWGQVVRLPDGTLTYRELPRPLVRVLEDPTPGNIRAYLDWRIGRTQKILRAAEIMKEYRASTLAGSGEVTREADPPEPPPSPAPGGPEDGRSRAQAPPPAPPTGPGTPVPFKVTYFRQRNCPHCLTEDALLARWLEGKPEGTLDVVEFGMKPELWRTSRVRGTPSLLLEDLGTRKHLLLEGVSRADELDRALGECRRAEIREGPGKGDRTR
jgi:hypothetical protein